MFMNQQPFRLLGRRLRELRNRADETLAEVSGAVEIDVKELAQIELGHSRPSEEVLMLLVSHFGAGDDEAIRLWELAGYHKEVTTPSEQSILFTDVVDVAVNKYGVVMNFMQTGGANNQSTPVARVGMSREHARSILKILQVTLSQTEGSYPKLPKRLIAPEDTSQN